MSGEWLGVDLTMDTIKKSGLWSTCSIVTELGGPICHLRKRIITLIMQKIFV